MTTKVEVPSSPHTAVVEAGTSGDGEARLELSVPRTAGAAGPGHVVEGCGSSATSLLLLLLLPSWLAGGAPVATGKWHEC